MAEAPAGAEPGAPELGTPELGTPDISAPDLADPRPRRQAVSAVVALGANLGDSRAAIIDSARRISQFPLVWDVRLSEVIETVALRPHGLDYDAPRYANAVVTLQTRLAPLVLMGLLHGLEEEFGRERLERWGDRTLDLDLVTYGRLQADLDYLQLPHPRAHERLFVLEPWLSLDAEAAFPDGQPVAPLVAQLRERGPA